ncbi:hypothetical protein QZH41_002580 [Actinostola sp. cb2023]|nr:hypothetical protein QZH41_002580 [Actinostola sp. cb2023]
MAAAINEITTRDENDKIHKQETLVTRQREEQLKFEKEQLELRAKYKEEPVKQVSGGATGGKPSVKLPKLVITKFDGKLEHWLSFWGKFEVEIDSAEISSVTKFAYLKELVEPRVGQAIDALPLTMEGYERAKNILKSKYGKTSEIINVYVENIMALPVINGTNPGKIHQFYQTLNFNVQSLETLGKTRECWSMLKSSDERKKHLKDNKLCFNCTGSGHRADKCRSRGTCTKCNRKSNQSGEGTPAMTATQTGGKMCHPVVVVTVNGVKCRALLDTGSTSTYISGLLVDLLGIKPTETATRSIKTIVGLVTKRIETYDVKISDTGGSCVLPVCATKVDRKELLSLENPNYPDIIKKYPYLEGVLMEDTATKPLLPIHVILGVNEYTKIRMSGYQRAGEMGEPVAEQTRFGWTIMTTGAEAELQNLFLTQTAVGDYEELCRLDVLGIQDVHSGDQGVVHDEFVEQLQRSPEGWYETGLPWKGDHPPLANNKAGSLKRLDSLVRKLKRDCLLDAYDAVTQEFYIPHKPIVKETFETTKLRVVYDASARGSATGPSLNDCLDIGPPLQNQIWKVLVCARFHGIVVAGDIRKAFLQVRIRSADRDALHIHWIDKEDPSKIRQLQFTRALFGLGPSPFLLGGVIQQHLNATREEHPDIARDIEQGLYVDDLLLGGQTVQDARAAKDTATGIFGKAGFELHKWNSNARELD